MQKGVDISHWNKVDWGKLKQDFVIMKCTQGTTYLDPTFKANKKAGLGKTQLGFYHFADGTNPVKEADWFLKNVGELVSGQLLVLDWEIEHADPVGWCKKFIKRVKEKTGKDCWLYTNDARAIKYPWPKDWKFWIARYHSNYKTYLAPKFKDWSIHQWTSRGSVPGIQGNVDLNVAKFAPVVEEKPEITPEPTPKVETPPEPISSPSEPPKDKQEYLEPKNQWQQMWEDLINLILKIWKK